MAKLESGVRLGRYELLIELGRGGMASVWVAREFSRASNKQRLVALKVMLPRLAKDSTFRSMFLDEGGLVRSIEHDHVVQVHEVAESQGLLYMAMEWVEGDSLRTVIKLAKQRRAIPSEMAVRIIADTAAGLHAAHELRGWDGELRGIVHCDVSPHNILIGPSGQAKLVDFGVAHAVAQSELEEEGNDTIKGKFGYMSPEQATGRKFDRRSDVFSLGIVLFELTTGERLFRGRDPTHTLRLVVHGEIPQPSRLLPEYPPALEAIVMQALERDVDKRFATAEALQQALDRYLVAERILVSHAGVGGLAKRVLGERIQARRAAIRVALRKLGQPSEATNLPASDVNAAEAPLDVTGGGHGSVTLGTTTGPGAAVLPGDLELTPPPRRRSSAGYVAAALALFGVAGAATYFIVRTAMAEGTGAESHVTVVRGEAAPAAEEAAPAPSASSRDDLASDARLEDLPAYRVGQGRPEWMKKQAKDKDKPTPAASSTPAAPSATAAPPPPAPTADPGFRPVEVPPVSAAPVPDEPAITGAGSPRTGPR